MPKILLLSIFLINFIPLAHAEDLQLSFDWGDIPLCTTGRPNKVDNPTFTLSSLPESAKWAYFKLKDLDVPRYNHGGGWVELGGNTTISADKFTYKSPCPPRGKHTYQWTAYFTAKKTSIGFSGKPKGVIAKVSAKQKYP